MEKNIKILLNTISEYCSENPEYCFWYSNRSNYYRLYLGYNTTFQKFKKGCEDAYGIIDKRFIKDTNLVFEYGHSDDASISKIQTYHNWDINDMHRYKLFTYCRQRVDNEFLYIHCFSTFFENPTEPVDIEKCLQYGQFKKTEDWDFFIRNLSQEDLRKIWSNYPNVISLAQYFNDNFTSSNKQKFLAPLITSDFINQVNEESLNFYQFLEHIFTQEEIKNYSNYSIVEKLAGKKDIYNPQEEDVAIEKVVISQIILKNKDYASYSFSECNAISLSIINEMNESLQLKHCGLIKIDSIINNEEHENTFYINKKQESLFNKDHFKDLFLETLQTFLLNPQIDCLKEIIPTIINNWYLQNSLSTKAKKNNQLKI